MPYTERYIGLAISIGIKIVLLYCLIAAGMGLGVGWLTEAQGIGTAPHPNMTAFDVMGAAVIFMMLCWQIPKLFSGVLGGAPALTGGDLVATGSGVFAGAVTVASLGAGAAALGARGVAAVSAAASAGGGSTAGNGAASAVAGVSAARIGGASAGGTVPPPPPSTGPNAGSPKQPDPPSRGPSGAAAELASVGSNGNGHSASASSSTGSSNSTTETRSAGRASGPQASSLLTSMGGESLSGSGFETQRPASGFAATSIPLPRSTVSYVDPPAIPKAAVPGGGSEVGPQNHGTSADAQALRSERSTSAPTPSMPNRSSGLGATAQKADRALSGASDRLKNASQRLRRFSLNDTVAPPSPPRMPVDHHD